MGWVVVGNFRVFGKEGKKVEEKMVGKADAMHLDRTLYAICFRCKGKQESAVGTVPFPEVQEFPPVVVQVRFRLRLQCLVQMDQSSGCKHGSSLGCAYAEHVHGSLGGHGDGALDDLHTVQLHMGLLCTRAHRHRRSGAGREDHSGGAGEEQAYRSTQLHRVDPYRPVRPCEEVHTCQGEEDRDGGDGDVRHSHRLGHSHRGSLLAESCSGFACHTACFGSWLHAARASQAKQSQYEGKAKRN